MCNGPASACPRIATAHSATMTTASYRWERARRTPDDDLAVRARVLAPVGADVAQRRLVASARDTGSAPITAARASEGLSGFCKAFFGLALVVAADFLAAAMDVLLLWTGRARQQWHESAESALRLSRGNARSPHTVPGRL